MRRQHGSAAALIYREESHSPIDAILFYNIFEFQCKTVGSMNTLPKPKPTVSNLSAGLPLTEQDMRQEGEETNDRYNLNLVIDINEFGG